jgi:hypothetical protein
MSISKFHEEVKKGAAPAPKVRQPRFSRWAVADIRHWLITRTNTDSGEACAQRVMDQAKRASRASMARRVASLLVEVK